MVVTRLQRGAADPFEFAQRDLDTLVGRLFNGQPETNGHGNPGAYGVDIREDADHFYVEAELPGFKKEEVDINLENHTLKITAERKTQAEQKGELVLHGRTQLKFDRTFRLPPTVDGNAVDAKLADGVLSITLNKREDSKPRKITVA